MVYLGRGTCLLGYVKFSFFSCFCFLPSFSSSFSEFSFPKRPHLKFYIHGIKFFATKKGRSRHRNGLSETERLLLIESEASHGRSQGLRACYCYIWLDDEDDDEQFHQLDNNRRLHQAMNRAKTNESREMFCLGMGEIVAVLHR